MHIETVKIYREGHPSNPVTINKSEFAEGDVLWSDYKEKAEKKLKEKAEKKESQKHKK